MVYLRLLTWLELFSCVIPIILLLFRSYFMLLEHSTVQNERLTIVIFNLIKHHFLAVHLPTEYPSLDTDMSVVTLFTLLYEAVVLYNKEQHHKGSCLAQLLQVIPAVTFRPEIDSVKYTLYILHCFEVLESGMLL